jgi:hypothetical protein
MKTLRRQTRLCLEELESRLVPSGGNPATSTNWSGYAVNSGNGSVTAVSGSWIVPTVSGTGTTYSSAWVGIDGYNSSSVEQTGTEMDVINGKPQYSAWYEMYPSFPVTLNMSIKPGDTMTASVTYNTTSGIFTLAIKDVTQNESFSTNQSGPSLARSSAEWIVEAPSSNTGVLPLANFGSVTFTNAQATIKNTTGVIDNAAWQSQVYQINMTKGGTTIASTSDLTDSGSPLSSAFTVAFGSTKPSAPGSTTPPPTTPPPTTPPPTTPPPSTKPIATTTTLVAAVNPYSRVPSVTLTAIVSPSVPVGSEVDLMLNGKVVSVGKVTKVNGVEEVSWVVYFYAPGTYTFTASFVGTGLYQSSTSNSITVHVGWW